MTAVDRTLEVMAAIRTALLADATVAALIGTRVYDTAPEAVTGPYMTIGSVGYRDYSTSSSEGQDMLMDVHCWDIPADRANAKNTANVRALMASVRRLFHDAALSVPARNVIVCRVTGGMPVMADADEIHGVVTVRVLIGHE